MNTYEITYQQLKERFEKSGHDVQGFLAPLIALCDESSSLIVGYSSDDSKIRENLIPYFHLVGHREGPEPLRALLVASWVGTEPVSSLAVARIVAALEGKGSLAHGMEVTAYPVLNLSAYREGVYLTSAQQTDGVELWKAAQAAHVAIFEREIQRYNYDLILNFRVESHATDLVVEGWADGEIRSKVFQDPLARYAEVAPQFQWALNPAKGRYARAYTPIPSRADDQPVEVTIGLPGLLSADEQTTAGLKIALTLLHQFRQARVEGLL